MWNKAQKEFIETLDGRVSLIAVAGSGKSTATVERIKNLVNHGVKPKDILATSFTKAGAEALTKKLKKEKIVGVKSSTIHSLAYSIVTQEHGGIWGSKLIPSWKTNSCLYDLYKVLGGAEDDFREGNILGAIGIQQGKMLSPKDNMEVREEFELEEDQIRYYYEGYENYKKKNDLMDFNDYIKEAIRIVKKKRDYDFKYCLCDEGQDISLLQYTLIDKVTSTHNLAISGDYQQAIFSFNSGDQRIIMDYYKNYEDVKVINMDINYRSGKKIIDNANVLTSYYYGNYKYFSTSKCSKDYDGVVKYKSFEDEGEESRWVFEQIKAKISKGEDLDNIAVIYRNNKMSQIMEALLKSEGIDYTITGGGSIFDYKEIKTINSILRLIESDYKDDLAMKELAGARILDGFKFLPNVDMKKIEDNAVKKGISLFESYYVTNYTKRGQITSILGNIQDIKDRFEDDTKAGRIIAAIISKFKIKEIIQRDNKDSSEGKLLAVDLVQEKCGNKTLFDSITFLSEGGQVDKKRVGLGKRKKSAITLTTAHSSKGLQWKITYVIQANKIGEINEDGINLAYVAITRAEEELYITDSGESDLLEVMKGNVRKRS